MDLISREAVLDIIDRKNVRGKLWVAREVEKLPSVKISYEAVNEVLNMAIEAQNMAIEALKAQKKGKWTTERLPSTNGGSYEVARCSECGEAFNWRMKYCGNCGALMRGDTDDEI